MDTDTFPGAELSDIAIHHSNSDMSEDERGQVINPNDMKQEIIDEDKKTATLPLKPEGILDKPEKVSLAIANLAPSNSDRSEVILAPKVHPSIQTKLSNEVILDWLEKQNPVLADLFAQQFHLSTNCSTRISHTPKPIKPDNVFKSRHTPNPVPMETTSVYSKAIEDILEQYQELNEEGQKDLWLSALASNDTDLIRELTNIRVRNAKVNSGTQLAKLTKDLLTHSEKHKNSELKYEEQAGKRRMYFHNWLTHLSAVIKMFSQTASVLDADNEIILFPDPTCVGNQALYMLLCSKVDNFYRNLIQREQNMGGKALKLLKSYCASCTIVDKNHFHRELTNLQIINDETAAHFLRCFTIAKTKVIIADNEYSDDETVDLCLAAVAQTKNVQYLHVIQHYLSERHGGHRVFLHEMERRLLAIDESSERETCNKR